MGGWATLAGTHGVWMPAGDSGYTHTHTHTHTQSPHRARMLLQPHASSQVERTPGSTSPGSALSAPGTGRHEAAGLQRGRAEAA